MGRPSRALIVLVCAAVSTTVASAASPPPPLPARTQLASDRAVFLKTAETGIAQVRKSFWNPSRGWYAGRTSFDPPVASTWTMFPLFEALNAIAIAHPTPANKAAVNTFAREAEGYWDQTIENGAGGVSWLYGLKDTGNAYFDDTGWWGVAYLDAYRASGNRRWLWDAGRALNTIDRFGWDTASGGVWWNVAHDYKTSESLAAGTLIAATLYRFQHKKRFLDIATRYINWANAHTRNPLQDNLYGRSATDKTIMDYVEGMMIAAHAELCVATKVKSWCAKAEALANGALRQFPIMASWAPETDVVYLRWLLDLYQVDRNPRWYSIVYANAKQALTHARDPQNGLWDLRWDGQWTMPDVLYTPSATLQLLAWAAAGAPKS